MVSSEGRRYSAAMVNLTLTFAIGGDGLPGHQQTGLLSQQQQLARIGQCNVPPGDGDELCRLRSLNLPADGPGEGDGGDAQCGTLQPDGTQHCIEQRTRFAGE